MKFNFIDYLQNKASTEEDVKFAYVKEFDIPFSTKDRNDCVTENTLFEFKYQKNFENHTAIAKILAQSFYYIHRSKYGDTDASVPIFLVVADRNEAMIFPVDDLKDSYLNSDYDWTRAPSNPDPKLIEDLSKSHLVTQKIYKIQEEEDLEIFRELLGNAFAAKGLVIDEKIITDTNFERVFEHWKRIWNGDFGWD